MKRPVPDGHITSPPQSVSMPRMRVGDQAVEAVHQAALLLLHGAEPEVDAERDEQPAEHDLRDRVVVVERRLDQILAVPAEEAQRGAEDAAERAARHQARGDDDAALAHRPARPRRPLVSERFVDEVRR